MARLLAYTLFGLFLFGLGSAGSWFLLQAQKATEEDAETAAARETTGSDPLARPAATETATTAEPMPVAVRGRPMSAEEIFRFGETIRKQMDALAAREEELDRQNSQLKLIEDELRGQQRELDGLYVQISESLKAGELLLEKIINERQLLQQDRQAAKDEIAEFENVQSQIDDNEVRNLKRTAQIIEDLSPEKAAELISELSDNGKMSMAVKLLDHIESRNAAEVLDNLNPVLMAQLLEELRGLQRPTNSQ